MDGPAYQQRIIDTLVNKVFVFDTDDNGGKKIVITYNTSRNVKSTITLSDVKSYLKSSDIEGCGQPKKTVFRQLPEYRFLLIYQGFSDFFGIPKALRIFKFYTKIPEKV